ncbi:MAG: serine/threonine-protein kinase [Pirellulaceae bacterium]
MSQANPQLEELIGEFSSALSDGSGPEIENFLPVHESGRITVLKELVATELESRIISGNIARVEDYFDRFPEIERHPDVLVDLVQFEYTTRTRLEPDLDIVEFQSRFPALVHLLRDGPSLYQRIIERDSSSDTLAERPSPVDEPLQQRFILDDVIATNASGATIWAARDNQLDRDVAITTIPDDRRAGSERPFPSEVSIIGQLEHPGIVPVYACGQLDDHIVCATRLVDNRTLRAESKDFHDQLLEGIDDVERELRLRQILRRFVDVCNTIHFAHSRHILHRDIKPDNIMVGDYGETLVVGWGAAQQMGCEQEEGSAAIVGTAGYMSPEQAQGQLDRLNARSDVYSLGATLFMTLTHRHPSQRTLVEQNYRLSTRPLAAICEKAMDPDPGLRYKSARAMADDIELYLADQPVSAYTDTATENCCRFLRRHERFAASIIGLLLVLLVIILAAWWVTV